MPVMEAGKGRIFNPQTSEWKDLTGPKRGPVAQVRWLTSSENVICWQGTFECELFKSVTGLC